MKKALFALAVVGMTTSVFAADGTILFGPRTIDNAAGTGTYNVPLWKTNGDQDTTTVNSALGGAGTLAGGVTVGLFLGNTQLNNDAGGLAQSLLRTDANAQFFATSSQTAVVSGVAPGNTASLTVRAWQGANGFAAAKANGLQYGEWTFTSKPLGGTPAVGQPIQTPTMTGWGPENSAGFDLIQAPEPTTIAFGALGIGALLLRRRK